MYVDSIFPPFRKTFIYQQLHQAHLPAVFRFHELIMLLIVTNRFMIGPLRKAGFITTKQTKKHQNATRSSKTVHASLNTNNAYRTKVQPL